MVAMSPSLETAQSQWLEQLEAMRKAIADLDLPPTSELAPAYGDDIALDDDDLSTTLSGEDIWDLLSDEYEEEYSSDHLDDDAGYVTKALYDQDWLEEQCMHVARRGSGLDAGALKEQISAILASDSNGMPVATFSVRLIGKI